MEAAARESRANAREDAVTITSGAKEKVDRTLASAQGLAEKISHPMDADARKWVDEKTDLRKAVVSAKQAAIRQMARQDAEKERFAARSKVAQLISQGQGANRYAQPPVQLPPAPLPAGADSTSATATEAAHPIESPPVRAATAGGLGDCTNSDYYYPPVPRPLPRPPQDSAVVADTVDVAVDSNPSMSANEVPAQANPRRDLTANKGVGK